MWNCCGNMFIALKKTVEHGGGGTVMWNCWGNSHCVEDC